MGILEIISFAIAFLGGALATALFLAGIFYLAKGLENILNPSKRFYKESRRHWANRCAEIEKDFRNLSDKYTALSQKFNQNTIHRQKLIEENEHWKSDVEKLAYDLGASDKEVQDLNKRIAHVIKENNAYIKSLKRKNGLCMVSKNLMREQLEIEKMRLDPKYNKNVVRGEDGRYKSLTN